MLSPLCTSGCNLQNACHFLLHCPNFLGERNTFLNKINIDCTILNETYTTVTETLLCHNLIYTNEVYLKILNPIIESA